MGRERKGNIIQNIYIELQKTPRKPIIRPGGGEKHADRHNETNISGRQIERRTRRSWRHCNWKRADKEE